LLTTRNPNSDEFAAEALEVEVLEKDDAIDLLSVRSGAELLENEQIRPEAELEEIVREVGCLPLAIEQAAAYIREVSKDIFKFLPSYRRNRKHHHNRKPKGNWKYGESIASTWHLSFKQVEQNNKGASKLLQLLAFLNPDGIYTDFLEAGNDALELDPQEAIGDPDLFNEALFELERFSLIRRQLRDDSQIVTIHRLVQSVIIDDMDQSEREVLMAQAIRLGISAFPDATQLNLNPNSLELSRRYRSQVMACLGHRQSESTADAWHFLSMRVTAFLYADGYYEECAKLASKTVDASKIYRGPDPTETLQSMHKLASTFRKLARGYDAMKLFQETLAVRTRVLGSEHLDTLRTMYGLACAFTDFAQPTEATKLHTESLAIRRRLLGDEHPETVQSMNGLAFAYWKLGERLPPFTRRLL
jgi:Tetratricopeptide repeat